MNSPLRYLHWFVAGLAAIYLMVVSVPPGDTEGQARLHQFGRIPILDHGRVKPIDTLARTSLTIISGREYWVDDKDDTHSAIEWLLDVMTSQKPFDNSAAYKEKVFRIENDEVLGLLDLKPRPGLRYSLDEFQDHIPQLEIEAVRAEKVDSKQRTVFDDKVLEVMQHLRLYVGLARLEADTLRVIPPKAPGGEWKTFHDAFVEAVSTNQDNLAARDFGMLLLTYAGNKPEQFNRALTDYDQHLNQQLPNQVGVCDFEDFFNHFQPFFQCRILYLVVFLLAAVAWLGRSPLLNRSALWLMVLTLCLHTWSLVARMYIQHRIPPVTNLYSSAIFIGWAAVVAGVILEVLFRNSLGNLVGSVIGFLTMYIAHHLATGGDTMEMLQAVLDTNFWLGTHVTCVALGYTATFVAGFLGTLFILRGLLVLGINRLGRMLQDRGKGADWLYVDPMDREEMKVYGKMIYGVVCFAMFFSFTGTVLGGIWADQSWGRFWGWDPKENGALLIVLWNALILHARWGGLVKVRGMALLTIVGNMITAWSWFGTNQLGVGLHSYGFNNQLAVWLVVFWISQVVLLVLGLLPQRWWLSQPPTHSGTPYSSRKASRHGAAGLAPTT